MTLIGVGSPKGGVSKSTLAVSLAALVAQHAPDLEVAVIDADENRTAVDWIETGGDDFPVRVSTASSNRVLRSLREVDLPLAFVDLPGARRGGELRALLTGTDGRPVVDFLLVPTQATRGDARVVLGAIEDDIAPTGVPYAVVLTRVPSAEVPGAVEQIAALNAAGIPTLATPLREYRAWRQANDAGLPISRVGGATDRARYAEDDLRAIARDVLTRAGVDVTIPATDRTPRRRLVALTATPATPEED